MNALVIALKDIQIFVKERGNVIYMFLLPMVFILVLSTAMQGYMEEDEDSLITLPLVNLDPGGEIAAALVEALDEAGGIQVEPYDQAEARALLKDAEIERVLTIPANLTRDVSSGQPVALRLVSHPDANETQTNSVLQVVEGVAQAQGQIEGPQNAPSVIIEQTLPQGMGEEVQEPNAAQQNVPGYTILFVFLTAQTTATSIYVEKKEGTFRRLLAAPIGKAALLTGKMIPNFVTALIQVVVIVGVSMLVLPRLGLDPLSLGDEPLALALVSLLLALCSTGLGILIAAIARTEGQISGLGSLVLWTAGAVGGCLFPPFLLSGAIGTVGKLVPHYWALRAYQDLIVRGRGLSDVGAEMMALLGFSLLFLAIGMWRFEFE